MNNNLKKIIKKAICGCLDLFPIKKNKIVVDNFAGKGFSDNPRYVIEALHSKAIQPLEIVWLVRKSEWNSPFPDYIKKVCIDRHGLISTIRCWYEYSTSHIWIDNIKNFSKAEKRRDQFYLQTWHGAIALKKIEMAASETLSQAYIESSKYDSKQIDLMISNSQWFNDDVYKTFWYHGKIAITGTPRNDVFFQDPEPIRKKVRKFYHLPDEVEIILYAPTFRGHLSPQDQLKVYEFDEQKVLNAFSNKYKRKFIILKRLHPNISNLVKMNETENVKNGSNYSDMQELLIASFALITDFSSSMFDFMLISNQIYLFTKDYDSYLENERGLNFDVKNDLPFPFAENENELITNINNFDEEYSNNNIDDFKKRLQIKEDGHASERVADILLNVMNR